MEGWNLNAGTGIPRAMTELCGNQSGWPEVTESELKLAVKMGG